MGSSNEWVGMVIAAAVAVLAFGISRYVVRRITQRRADKAQAQAKSLESRQVRRARERQGK
ncbi:hypothetical protein [Hydrogenophaga sp. BPS33]|uniref:hypothetical protein n=1 Tax=Hydrogenophaga sp. BPS33 TaxID=2651974 RepID=UPI0013202D5D|nr:hypothetical protein [Hydrogenophaga sp. BPS33]QHE85284.1 hypothetical protein F9K07_10455 [Hydrogenophaga sp. BPS33]